MLRVFANNAEKRIVKLRDRNSGHEHDDAGGES
jgi:hypothetical protein